MLAVRWLGLSGLVAMVLTAAPLAACGGSATPPGEAGRQVPNGATQSDSAIKETAEVASSGTVDESGQIVRRVIIGYPWWGAGPDETLVKVVNQDYVRRGKKDYIIIVGRVTAADVNLDTSLIGHEHPPGEGPPPGHPKAEPPPTPDPNDPNVGIPFTHYKVQVERVIRAPGIKEGDSINVSQMGGLIDGVAYENEGDPVITVGTTYLFFVSEARPGTWVSKPWLRLPVDAAGQVQPVDDVRWGYVPIVKALRGLTVDQAVAAIGKAMAKAGAQR